MGSEAGPFPLLSANRRLDRGNSDIDLRQRWALMASYQPPFGNGRTGLQGVLMKGWQVNAIAALQTGQTFTIQNSSARDNTGSGDRPNVVGDPYSTPQTPNQNGSTPPPSSLSPCTRSAMWCAIRCLGHR